MQLLTFARTRLAFEIERSPAARRRAERALLRLAKALQTEKADFVVLGGLLPEVLTKGRDSQIPTHLGTTDVDIFLTFHLDVDRSLIALERALGECQFEADPKQAGWRWLGRVDGAGVKLEFLCDREDQAAETAWIPAGCTQLAALNLRGTGFVATDWEWEYLDSDDGSNVRVRFAGLQGYVMTKVHVARERGADKDYYDLVYTLLYNKLARPQDGVEGPVAVGQALAGGKFGHQINLASSVWMELAARFQGPDDVGPRAYADEAVRADPESDHAQHRQDGVSAVIDFLSAIRAAQRAD